MVNSVTSGGTVSRFGELIYLLTGNIGEISSLQVRFKNWQLAIDLFEEYIPFGTLVSHSYVKEITTDNMYFSWLLQGGIVGIVSLVFIYTSTLICSVSEYSREQTQSISLLTTLFVLSVGIGSLTTDLLGYTPIIVVFWVVLGLAFGTFESGRIEFKISGYSSR
jgi:hypothetical protein